MQQYISNSITQTIKWLYNCSECAIVVRGAYIPWKWIRMQCTQQNKLPRKMGHEVQN